MRACLKLVPLLLAAAAPLAQGAADFPQRPLRMVVPLAPGGGSDIVGRLLATALAEQWRKPVVVDNRPGGGSIVGTGIVAKAPADGYTVLVSSSSFAISPALYKDLPYDARRDFAPVTLLASQPSLLVVHPGVPARNLKDLLALARTKPGQLSYASAGVGSATHLGSELLLHAAKLQVQHIPYKSAGQATTAVLSGEAQLLLTNMASVLPYVGTGKLRALGTSALTRVALAPEVPTLAEGGLSGFEYATWYGMLAPAGTPPVIVSALHDANARVLKEGVARERLAGQGLLIHAEPPARFTRYLDTELKRWHTVIGAAGITAD